MNSILDLYTDYLIASFSKVTATGLSELVDGAYSHDQITRSLSLNTLTQKIFWIEVKPVVRRFENEDGVLIVDDFIEEKAHTGENDIMCWHFDHAKRRSVKGVNIINFLYHAESDKGADVSLPVSYEIVHKTEVYVDKKTGKTKRRSPITKNELVRARLKILIHTNRIKCRYIVFDSWYASKENLEFIKLTLKKDAVCALKENRTAALSMEDKLAGRFVPVSNIDIKPGETRLVYLKGLEFPVLLAKQIFTNEDGSTGVLYLVSTDTSLTYDQITTIYKRRWKVEVVHKSVKQNTALEKSPTKTVTTQTNHIAASFLAYVKLELMSKSQKLNQFALKTKLYIKALKASFEELKTVKETTKLMPVV